MGTPSELFRPRPGSAPGGSGRKTTTLVRDHEYFIPTKFHQNPSHGSGEEVENVNILCRTDGRTDDGRCAITIAHWSLRLWWAKKLLLVTSVMILAGDEYIWNRLGVEGAGAKPLLVVWGQSPHPLKTNCILKALDCLKFVAKRKQVTFFPLIILFNFVQFLISFRFCFFIVLSSHHFHSWSVLWTSICF